MNADQISSLRPEGKDSRQCAIRGSILKMQEEYIQCKKNVFMIGETNVPSSYYYNLNEEYA